MFPIMKLVLFTRTFTRRMMVGVRELSMSMSHSDGGLEDCGDDDLEEMMMMTEPSPWEKGDKSKKRKKRGTKPNFQEENKGTIARILGVQESEVRKPPRKQIVEESAREVYSVLQTHGFRSGEVLCYPDLFMMSPHAASNYIEIMNESLFTSVGLPQILNFNPLQKQSVKLLHELKRIPTPPEIVGNYFDVLEMPKKSHAEESVWNAIPVDTSRLTLKELRQIVMVQFIAWKLECTPKAAEPMISKYKRISHRCLSWIKQSLELLMKESCLDKEKILNHGYLLQSNPENTADVLRNISSLSGIPMTELLYKRPKILMSTKTGLLEIEELFAKHNIPAKSIIRHPELFTLSPSTLRDRLLEFDTVPEFRILKNHPRVSRLIYYQNKAKLRVEYFRSINRPGVSLHLLSMDRTRFKNRVLKGEVRTRGMDILNFLKNYFNMSSSDVIHQALQKQPHWLHCASITVKESLGFLEECKMFSKSQMLDALPLILYPKDKIAKEIEAVVASGEAKMTDAYFLHMVLYFLEKSVHFSGDGLWHSNYISDNLDDEAVANRLDLYLESEENPKHRQKPIIDIEEEEDGDQNQDDVVFGDSLHETLNSGIAKKRKT